MVSDTHSQIVDMLGVLQEGKAHALERMKKRDEQTRKLARVLAHYFSFTQAISRSHISVKIYRARLNGEETKLLSGVKISKEAQLPRSTVRFPIHHSVVACYKIGVFEVYVRPHKTPRQFFPRF